VKLSTSLESGLGRVLADHGHVEVALLNLVINARDAMRRGGSLTIRTRTLELSEAEGGRRPGRYAVLEVSDTGCGMEAETVARIFEPYFTTKSSGTGLGLAIVHGIVVRSGGWITVESTVHEGTTFRLHWPEIDQFSVPTPTPKVAGLDAQNASTLLVADSDTMVRSVVAYVLQAAGYTVFRAASLDEARRQAEAHPDAIDLLLVDAALASDGGDERALARRVLYVSGYPRGASDEGEALADDVPFLQKPFTPRALLDQVHELLAADPVSAVTGDTLFRSQGGPKL
jgi:hypothetical protein